MPREMKETGIEWIGEVPKDWDIKKLKYLTVCLDGMRIPLASNVRESGIYPYWGAGSIQGYINDYIFDEEIILLGEDGAPFFDKTRDVAFLINEKVWVNNHIHVLKGVNCNNKFLVYFLNIVDYVNYINGSILNKLTQYNMKNISIATPPLEEQKRIADLLDKKCQEIEEIKETIEAEIKTLDEYKKSIITEAVTKGLDKGAEMKDSGIEWIGQIPKHWKIIRLKDISSLVRGGSPRPISNYMSDDENDLNWIKIGDAIKDSKYITNTKCKLKKSGLNSTTIVNKGDLILSNSMSYGEAYILNIDGCIHDGWLAFKNIRNIIQEYLYFTLLSESTLIQFDKLSDGGVVKNLNIDKVKTVKIFLPPINEQKAIAEYLDHKTGAINEAIEGKRAQLVALDEYKKSLIYEYVTGKKEA